MTTQTIQAGHPPVTTTHDICQPRPLPGPQSAAWQNPATVQRIAHPAIHPVPQPDCDLCPTVPCPCGALDCPDVFDHRRLHAGSETTYWQVAA